MAFLRVIIRASQNLVVRLGSIGLSSSGTECSASRRALGTQGYSILVVRQHTMFCWLDLKFDLVRQDLGLRQRLLVSNIFVLDAEQVTQQILGALLPRVDLLMLGVEAHPFRTWGSVKVRLFHHHNKFNSNL